MSVTVTTCAANGVVTVMTTSSATTTINCITAGNALYWTSTNMAIPCAMQGYQAPATTGWYVHQRLPLIVPPPPRPRPDAVPAFTRSLRLYRRLRGNAEIDDFLAGKVVVIRGVRFDYAICKRDGGLLAGGGIHIPYLLFLLEKGTEKRLGQGCVVIRDTPVIDQILAMTLHVQDDAAELDFLRITNWTATFAGALRPVAALLGDDGEAATRYRRHIERAMAGGLTAPA